MPKPIQSAVQLLKDMDRIRNGEYRSDPERDGARLDGLEYLVREILHKLKEQEERR